MSDGIRRIIRRCAWSLLVLLLLAVAAWTVGNVVGSSRFEAALRMLEDSGYPTSAIGLAPPKLPPGEDAAPYYSAAFALHVSPPEDPDNTVDWAPDPPTKILEMTPEQRAKLKAWLAENQEAFDMVARARKRPRCRYEHDFSQGYSMLLPEVANILGLARALEVRAVLQSLDGDPAGAQESVRSILALGESLREEPVLVEQLVRLVAVRLAMSTIDACVSGKTSDDDLRSWSELLPKDGFLDGALNLSLRGEMGMLADTIAGPQSDAWAQMWGMGALPARLLRPLFRTDAARFLTIMRQATEESGKPYPAARAGMDAIEGIHRQGGTWSRPVCNTLLPALGTSLERVTAAQAHVAVVRAGLVAELERRKTGKVPEKIGIRDPFTGQPLLLSREGGLLRSDVPASMSEKIEWVFRAAGK